MKACWLFSVLVLMFAVTPVLAQSDNDPETAAYGIVFEGCGARGNTGEYCSCVLEDFQTRVFPAANTPEAALGAAVMMYSDSMNQAQMMSVLSEMNPDDQTQAVMLMGQYSDLGEACDAGAAITDVEIEGTPEERLTQICIIENDSPELCQCLTDKLAARMGPDDLELLADIRTAAAQGAADPLAKVANDRGFSREEAEEALANNGAMMNIGGADLMSCMGAAGTGFTD